MNTQFTIIHHGRTSERRGTFKTLDEATEATKFWNIDPMLTVTPMQHLPPGDANWIETDSFYRTNNVAKHRTVARYFTGNPDTSLSIVEEVIC